MIMFPSSSSRWCVGNKIDCPRRSVVEFDFIKTTPPGSGRDSLIYFSKKHKTLFLLKKIICAFESSAFKRCEVFYKLQMKLLQKINDKIQLLQN
jgi:hypothetical protein